MRNIAVTGAAGFIGHALLPALVDAGFQVSAIDRVACGDKPIGARWICGDLLDADFATEALHNAHVCIALAGMSGGVGYFSTHPASILRDNILIAAHTLDACIKNGVHRIVYISSSCVFPGSLEPPFREEDTIIPQQPLPAGYAFSKTVGERLCQSYREQYGLDFTIVRPFNVFGPGELPGTRIGDGHVIPELTARILKEKNPIILLGTGEQTRSFLFIDDFITALLAIIRKPAAVNMDFNIGSDHEVSMIDLAKLIWTQAELTGTPQFRHMPGFSGDVPRRGANASRAQKLLDWSPIVILNAGIKRYIEWYSTTIP